MAQVKLGLRDLSIPELIAKIRQVVIAMTGNATYPTPSPTLAALTAAADDLEAKLATAEQARLAAEAATAVQDTSKTTAETLVTAEGNYVQQTSGGDAAKIESAGMEVRDPSTPIGDLPAPTDLNATVGDHDGQIDLHWDHVRGAKSYLIEKSLDPPTAISWSVALVATKSSASVTGLTSGTKYWFRVAAVGAAGNSGWSQPAVKIAP